MQSNKCNLQVQKGLKPQSERKEFTSWLMTNNEPLKSEAKQDFKRQFQMFRVEIFSQVYW